MKFYGRGIVWDNEADKILFEFSKEGLFETEDQNIIDKALKVASIKFDTKEAPKVEKKEKVKK